MTYEILSFNKGESLDWDHLGAQCLVTFIFTVSKEPTAYHRPTILKMEAAIYSEKLVAVYILRIYTVSQAHMTV
jgi:hypothetical protein